MSDNKENSRNSLQKLELADIATNEKKVLKGFKVLGLFPFYLKFICVGTHIKLCKIKELINRVAPNDFSANDFYDSELQANVIPLILEYCSTALLNDRPLSFLFRPIINSKLKRCGHYHLLNLFFTIHRLNEPAFFLTYWRLIKQKENTLLKEDIQS